MHIEVMAVGDEILKGSTVNSNATTISRKLDQQGYACQRHIVIGDASNEIKQALVDSLNRSSVVIVTGGLGPTIDDLTKSIMGEVFDTPFIFSPSLEKELLKRFPNLLSVKQLATIPLNAQLIPNLLGTCPGFLFSRGEKKCFFVSGVPSEMESMLDHFLLPYLMKEFPIKNEDYRKVLDLCLLNEDEIEAVIIDDLKKNSKVHCGIYPYYGGVRVELKADLSYRSKVDEIAKKLLLAFPDSLFSSTGESMVEILQKAFEDRGLKLATAESCTGGALATAITAVPGASVFFLGSIVAYANSLKESVLKVSPYTLDEKGAVSLETIEEMLLGIFRITEADVAIAISGIAGPGGATEDKPVGTVWVGIGKRGEKADIGVIHAPPSRSAVVQCTVNTVLGILWRRIVHNKLFFNDK